MPRRAGKISFPPPRIGPGMANRVRAPLYADGFVETLARPLGKKSWPRSTHRPGVHPRTRGHRRVRGVSRSGVIHLAEADDRWPASPRREHSPSWGVKARRSAKSWFTSSEAIRNCGRRRRSCRLPVRRTRTAPANVDGDAVTTIRIPWGKELWDGTATASREPANATESVGDLGALDLQLSRIARVLIAAATTISRKTGLRVESTRYGGRLDSRERGLLPANRGRFARHPSDNLLAGKHPGHRTDLPIREAVDAFAPRRPCARYSTKFPSRHYGPSRAGPKEKKLPPLHRGRGRRSASFHCDLAGLFSLRLLES